MYKTVVVTGANTGIGFGVCKYFVSKVPNLHLVFTYRNKERGISAWKELISFAEKTNQSEEHQSQQGEHGEQHFKLGKQLFSHHQLDVTDKESIEEFGAWCKKNLSEGIDILINNAGVASKGSSLDRSIAESTIGTNYFGLKHVTEALLDQIKDRVVNVSSGSGQASGMNPDKKNAFLNAKDVSELEDLIAEFLESVDKENWEEKGFIGNSYSISKLSVNALTRIWSREKKGNLTFVAICPGWVKTNMGGDKAPRTTEESAKGIYETCFEDAEKVHGKFLRDNVELPW